MSLDVLHLIQFCFVCLTFSFKIVLRMRIIQHSNIRMHSIFLSVKNKINTTDHIDSKQNNII